MANSVLKPSGIRGSWPSAAWLRLAGMPAPRIASVRTICARPLRMLLANPTGDFALETFHRSCGLSLRPFSAFCMSIRCSRTVGTWYPSSRARRRTICIFLLRAAAIRGADAPDAAKSRSRSSCSCVQIMLGLSNKWGHGRCGGPATVPLPVHAPGQGAWQINAPAGISVPNVWSGLPVSLRRAAYQLSC